MAQVDRAARLLLILERDGARCVWCNREIDTPLVRATTEHLVPKLKGGPSWIENELAACSRCNSRRGHSTPCQWLAQCEASGWQPRREVVRAGLLRLQEAIGERGGQRRARDYVKAQLRRLDRLGQDPLHPGAAG
ncbi:MAG: HNH endonuclease [Acidimicrobiales bacterium]